MLLIAKLQQNECICFAGETAHNPDPAIRRVLPSRAVTKAPFACVWHGLGLPSSTAVRAAQPLSECDVALSAAGARDLVLVRTPRAPGAGHEHRHVGDQVRTAKKGCSQCIVRLRRACGELPQLISSAHSRSLSQSDVALSAAGARGLVLVRTPRARVALDTSTATLELESARPRRSENKAPFACLGC